MSEPASFPRQSARTRRFTLGEPRSITIAAGGERVLFLRALSGSDPSTGLWALEVTEGAERLVVDPGRLSADGDLPAQERALRERLRETASGVVAYAADDAGAVAAFALAGRLWVAEVATGGVREIPTPSGVFDPRPDPTGRHIAYVAGDELRLVGVDGAGDRRLAGDDVDAVAWGRAEFVAAEEMSRLRGYWWAPEGNALLAARVDERAVTVRWVSDLAHPDRAPVALRYPVAGTTNADVTLHLLGLDGRRVEVAWDRDAFPYLARVSWSADGPPLVAVQTRDQRTVQVRSVDVTDGSTAVVCEDTDDVWVELFPGAPTWHDGQVVRIADDAVARRLWVGDEAVTGDDVYVRAVVAAGAAGVVFTASLGDPTEVHVLRYADGAVERITDEPGVHGAVAGGDTVVLSSASLDRFGWRHVVRSAKGDTALRSVSETPVLTPRVRVVTLGARDLRAGVLLPSTHEPGTKLPVLLDPYGGPHAQRVLSSRAVWLTSQWLADQGFAVVVADGRGTPGREPSWERAVWHDVCDGVLADQVEALQAAAALEPDLDLSRVGIRGWSFGGYLAALAVLRRPDVFHAAVAGAPCTEWSLYDTHYTERYLGLPGDNPDVYRRHSLLDDAASLRRPLMLIHGLADDNVLAAHTLRLSQRLTEAGRPHTVLPLSGVTHMTPQEAVAENLLLLQVEFLRRALAG